MKDRVGRKALKDFLNQRKVTNIAEDRGVRNIAAIAQKEIDFMQLVFGTIKQHEKTRRGRGQGCCETGTDRATGTGNENAFAGVGGPRWINSGRHVKLRFRKTAETVSNAKKNVAIVSDLFLRLLAYGSQKHAIIDGHRRRKAQRGVAPG
jgi:hypothetical protein